YMDLAAFALAVVEGNDLPVVRIMDLVDRVHGLVEGVVGIGGAIGTGFVAMLIGAVVAAIVDDGRRGHVAHSLRRRNIVRVILRIEALLLHLLDDPLLIFRE